MVRNLVIKLFNRFLFHCLYIYMVQTGHIYRILNTYFERGQADQVLKLNALNPLHR